MRKKNRGKIRKTEDPDGDRSQGKGDSKIKWSVIFGIKFT